MGRTFAIIYQVCVWEQFINIVAPNDSRLLAFYR